MKGPVLQKATQDFTLLIFGASGSLAQLKLFPSLYELVQEKRMPRDYKIVGYGRSPMSDSEFRQHFSKSIHEHVEYVDKTALAKMLKNVFYVQGEYDKAEDYHKALKRIKEIEKNKSRIRMAYFSVPPAAFDEIFVNLSWVPFGTRMAPLRLVIEKPFGTNFRSAKRLQKILSKRFKPEQIFLLDHYLGKEAVSNLLSLRYANSILSTLLNREHVSNIQIFSMEDVDIEKRANYFDHVGIVKDMVQSHLLQILAYLTMNFPKELTSQAIHEEKARILESIRITNLTENVVRGQYQGYRKEEGVPHDSQTETFTAIRMELKHPLWKGVPIFMRCGKALKQKWTAVVIEFKAKSPQLKHGDLAPNRLVIQIQPTEKIEFHLLTKLGGKTFDFHDLNTGRPIYCSGDCLSEHGRLLLDVVEGKQGLFLNFREILAAWRVIDPIEKKCRRLRERCSLLHIYPKGSLGPKAADQLIEKEGFHWFYSLAKK